MAEADNFDQPNTIIVHRVGSDFTKKLDRVLEHFQTTSIAESVFTNSHHLSVTLRQDLEGHLNKNEICIYSW